MTAFVDYGDGVVDMDGDFNIVGKPARAS